MPCGSILRTSCIRVGSEQVPRTAHPHFVSRTSRRQFGKQLRNESCQLDEDILLITLQVQYGYHLSGENIAPFGCLETNTATVALELKSALFIWLIPYALY